MVMTEQGGCQVAMTCGECGHRFYSPGAYIVPRERWTVDARECPKCGCTGQITGGGAIDKPGGAS